MISVLEKKTLKRKIMALTLGEGEFHSERFLPGCGQEFYSKRGFLIFNHLNGLVIIDDWIWCGLALIAYLGDCELGD